MCKPLKTTKVTRSRQLGLPMWGKHASCHKGSDYFWNGKSWGVPHT